MKLPVEYWKALPGYEGAYEVSSMARIRSLNRIVEVVKNNKSFLTVRKGRMLRPGLSGNGYYTVSIGRKNSRCLHDLVAETFLGPRPVGHDVCHIDGNKQNNLPRNLKYGKRSENNRDISRHDNRRIKLAEVKHIRKSFRRYKSIAAAWRSLGHNMSYKHFYEICKNKIWTGV